MRYLISMYFLQWNVNKFVGRERYGHTGILVCLKQGKEDSLTFFTISARIVALKKKKEEKRVTGSALFSPNYLN